MPPPARRPALTVLRLDDRAVPAVFTVTNLGDDANTPLPGSLRFVLDQAAGTPEPDTILFDQSLVGGSIQLADTLTIGTDVTIEGTGITLLGLSGSLTGPMVANLAGTSTLVGLTFRDHTPTFVPAEPDGAVVNQAALTLVGVTATNVFPETGGVVENSGTLIVTGATITGNFGSGIRQTGAAAQLTVSDTTLLDNFAGGSSGGGGGAAVFGGQATFDRVRFAGNTAEGAGGGLLVTDFMGTEQVVVTVNDSVFDGNEARLSEGDNGVGGGMAVENEARVTVVNSTFTANTAVFGGGFGYNLTFFGSFQSLVFRNSTFDGNSAFDFGNQYPTNGGGLAIAYGSGLDVPPPVELTNVTVTRNRTLAGDGGGLALVNPGTGAASVFTVRNLLAAGNQFLTEVNTGQAGPPVSAAPDAVGAFVSAGGNLIQDASAATFTPGPGDLTGVAPDLDPLGDYGGPTPTVRLRPASPGLGIGQTGGPTPTTDQRGFPRPAGGPIDPGAFQLQPPAAGPTTFTTPFDTPLTVPAPGLLAAVAPADPVGAVTAALAAGPPASAGTVVVNADGSFTFTPAAGFVGTTSFTFVPVALGRPGDPVTVTVTVQPGARRFAVGAGAGGAARVRTYDFDGTPRLDFEAFEGSFRGGVRVATGDVTGDGVPDVIAGAGPGGGPRVRVFDGQTGDPLLDFFPFEMSFTGGVYVAAGDVTGDGRAEIVVGAGSLGAPRVMVFDGATGAVLRDFFAYAADFRGGVRVAVGDLDGDGLAEIVTAPGSSGGPHVRAFSGATGATIADFFAYDITYRGGLFVGVRPAVGDRPGTIVVGLDTFPEFAGSVFEALALQLANTSGRPADQVLPTTSQLIAPPLLLSFDYDPTDVDGVADGISVFAYPDGFDGGVRVTAGDLAGDFRAVTGPGPGAGGVVKLFREENDVLVLDVEFQPFGDFAGSVFVG